MCYSPSAHLYTPNKMINKHEDARRLLFRALTGAEPMPTTAEIAQAQTALATDTAAHAALDELLTVITCADRTPPGEWYEQLHAYATAQLAGQGDVPKFAALRRLLDADVALAEEYALLYETLRAEATGLLPQPQAIPPVDLSFLPTPVSLSPALPAPLGWLAQQRLVLGNRLAALAHFFRSRSQLPQLATVAALAMVLLVGVWLTEFSGRRSTVADNPATSPTATTVSRIDPRQPEEPLRQWANKPNNRLTVYESPAFAACTESVTSPIARRGCPM